MAQDMKRVLVVDDSLVDRMIIKSILEKSFEVVDVDSGHKAFEYISTKGDKLDALLLDLSMPHIDGFDVLNFMKEKGIDEIPVFVVTTESTTQNVAKAFRYNISDFIKKPYDHEDVVERLRSRLGVIPEYDLTKEDLVETNKYIEMLESFYKTYLANFGKNDARYRIRAGLMKIMLNAYQKTEAGKDLSADNIELLSKAAYFCDIGELMLPEKRWEDHKEDSESGYDARERHTMLGADFIKLNRSKACRYFVEICAGMCRHHHERYDGMGYPDRIKNKGNSIYNQICRVVDELEAKRLDVRSDKAMPVKIVIRHLVNDSPGLASKEVYNLLKECEQLIVNYYRS